MRCHSTARRAALQRLGHWLRPHGVDPGAPGGAAHLGESLQGLHRERDAQVRALVQAVEHRRAEGAHEPSVVDAERREAREDVRDLLGFQGVQVPPRLLHERRGEAAVPQP